MSFIKRPEQSKNSFHAVMMWLSVRILICTAIIFSLNFCLFSSTTRGAEQYGKQENSALALSKTNHIVRHGNYFFSNFASAFFALLPTFAFDDVFCDASSANDCMFTQTPFLDMHILLKFTSLNVLLKRGFNGKLLLMQIFISSFFCRLYRKVSNDFFYCGTLKYSVLRSAKVFAYKSIVFAFKLKVVLVLLNFLPKACDCEAEGKALQINSQI